MEATPEHQQQQQQHQQQQQQQLQCNHQRPRYTGVAEEEQKQRVAEKQAKREHNKRKLLDTFARHKAASRSEQRAQVAKVAPGPPAKADEPQKKKKRVSFA